MIHGMTVDHLIAVTNFNFAVLGEPVFAVSDQVRHKPGCTATEDV